MLRSPVVQEDMLLASTISVVDLNRYSINCVIGSVCQILIGNLLGNTEVEEPGMGMATTIEEYAIYCLYQLPFNLLKRNERNMIVQYLTSRLLNRTHPPLQYACYITFLAYCLQHSSKSTQLVGET